MATDREDFEAWYRKHAFQAGDRRGWEGVGWAAWQARAALASAPAAAEHPLMAPEALLKTIGTLLGDAMNTAVENGANSVSMPDEYVALAAWLCETPAAPQPAEPAQPATQAGAAPQPATTCPWCSACGCGNDVCGYAHLPGCLRAAQAQAQAEKGGA